MSVQVPEKVVGILGRLVSGSVPLPLALGRLTMLTWGAVDLSMFSTSSIAISGDKLQVTCSSESTAEAFSTWNMVESGIGAGAKINGSTDAGLHVFAEQGRARQLALRSGGERAGLSFNLIGHYWWIADTDNLPSIWVGRLRGSIEVLPGNLVIGHSMDHLRLVGAYCYYLVRTRAPGEDSDTWYMVIDLGESGIPQRALLYPDFLAMQFSLGKHLCLDLLLGIDSEGRTVAESGGRFGQEHPDGKRTACPVPHLFSKETWLAPFFEHVSQAYRSKPELRLYVPLGLYLDALVDHLDGSYLKLHVALEAFSLNLLKQIPEEKTVIVKEWKDWSRWVNENRERIESFAIEKFRNSLVEKVRNVARLASGRVVPTALGRLGIEVTEAMKEELEGRDIVAHTALMSIADDRDYERDLERIALVRTMLVALVARSVGYQGPIVGWTRDSNRRYEPADSTWWQFEDDDLVDARTVYIVDDAAPGDQI